MKRSSDRTTVPIATGERLILQPDATAYDIGVLPLSTGATPRPLPKTRSNESQARLSPDGRWLAYVSDESGHEEVGRFVMIRFEPVTPPTHVAVVLNALEELKRKLAARAD